MNFPIPAAAPAWLNGRAIETQLERIFLHPDFSSSEILKRFLTFVVQETLTGNANCLKEYTIALKVLQKPVNFNPQKNCIVRIHAGRLRRALYHYYNAPGSDDEIIIGIPKGKYVPVFMDRQQWLDESLLNKSCEVNRTHAETEPLIFAILPFNYNAANEATRTFLDDLCLQISSALSQVKQISVTSYQVVKSMAGNYSDLKELSTTLRFNHIISVGAQYQQKRSRVNIQIIDCRYYQQIWSRVFDCTITDSNLFEVQDGICQVITNQASNYSCTNIKNQTV
jgi:TolB-like protein